MLLHTSLFNPFAKLSWKGCSLSKDFLVWSEQTIEALFILTELVFSAISLKILL